MATVPTPRTGLKTFTSGTDPHPSRTDHNAERELLDALMALAAQGTTAARPAAGIPRRFYWDTDVDRLYFDTGTTWKEVTTNGGGGPGATITPGAAAVEGTSARSARADHTHALALATAAAHGAMSSADKAKLDNATAAPTASRLVVRDAAGRAQFAEPVAAADAATKAYVDLIGQQAAAGVHTHTAAEINSGTLDPARLPAATTSVQGAMSSEDKTKLDAAVFGPNPYTLVMRGAAGRAQFADPSVAADAATKNYVDTGLAGKAPTAHNHSWSQITSGVPTAFPPSAHTHAAADIASGTLDPARLPAVTVATQGAMLAADKLKLDNAVSAATASRMVIRDAAGRAQFAAPSASADVATKGYVDTGLGGKSDTTHTHTFASITSKPAVYPSDWNNVAGKPDAFTPAGHQHNVTDIVGQPGFTNQRHFNDTIWTENYNRVNSINDLYNTKLSTATYITRVRNNGQHTILTAENGEGAVTLGADATFYAPAIFNRNAASGSYRAVWVNGAGLLGYNLSSRKYKANERDYQVPLELLDQVAPKRFQYKHEVEELGSDAAPWRVNFMAEDLHEAGLTEYVSYDGDPTVENAETINEQLMVNALWSFAKQQRDQIADLQSRLRAVEGADQP